MRFPFLQMSIDSLKIPPQRRLHIGTCQQRQPGGDIGHDDFCFLDDFLRESDIVRFPTQRLKFAHVLPVIIDAAVAGTREQPTQRPTDLFPACIILCDQSLMEQPADLVDLLGQVKLVRVRIRVSAEQRQDRQHIGMRLMKVGISS